MERTEPRLSDYKREEYVRCARRAAIKPDAGLIGQAYSYATFDEDERTVPGLAKSAMTAIEHWLAQPAEDVLRGWHEFKSHEYPRSVVGVVLKAAGARLHIEYRDAVHQSLFAALAELSTRTIRKHIEAGELAPFSSGASGSHREWLTSASCKKWLEKRRAAREVQ